MGMLPLTLAQIARALGGEVSGSQVLAPGPNHSRDDRSLSIRLAADAPDGFVVHSFAEDDPLLCRDHVRARLNLPAWEPAAATSTNRVAAEYVYRDAEGRPYLRVRRTHDKQFWQSHWNGSEWVKGKPQGPKIPYRLPELLAASDPTVIIVEGEKDADALVARGFPATTASEGAGKWQQDLNRWFAGKIVCIIPDNDAPGRAHAQMVAHNVISVAKQVRIVELPDLPPKGDVSDWLAHGGDSEKLIELCRAAPLVTAAAPSEAVGLLKARPFVWIDPTSIPPREWLYGRHYIRGFIGTTVAPGGVGKSSLAIVEALAMASGKALVGVTPKARCRVWYWNGEDPHEELDRRVMAAAVHFGLTREDLEGWLFVNSGRDTPLVVAHQTPNGVRIAVPTIEILKSELREIRADVLIVDPFVSSHQVNENDNNAVERVAKTWAGLAEATNAAIDLIHHVRKTNGAEVTVEDGRGASALLAAARSGRVLNVMTEDEGAKAGVERHWQHFRVNVGKVNMAARPPEGAAWFKLLSVDLGNGDDVGVVDSWTWPDALDDVSVADLRAAQKAVAAGRWREDVRAKQWVGNALADALSLDLGSKHDKAKVIRLLKIWTSNGMFKVVEALDEQRRPRAFVEVDEWAND